MARKVVVALGVIVVLGLAACGGSNDSGGGLYGGGGGTMMSPTPGMMGSASPGGMMGSAENGNAVSISGSAFSPADLTVTAGTKVTWTNEDSTPHTVTSTDGPSADAKATTTFDSGDLAQADTFSYSFETAGTYYYECTIHAAMPSMHAVVLVK